MGLVCPRTGEFFGMTFTACDTDCFQVFLDEAGQCVDLTESQKELSLTGQRELAQIFVNYLGGIYPPILAILQPRSQPD